MISAVVLTKNEEDQIDKCLETLSFCNEILVVDDDSNDKTVEIALKRGAIVIKHPLRMDFAAQNNFAIEKVKHDWVLFVDADERITSELKDEILKRLSDRSNYGSFIFKRIDYMWQKWIKYGEVGSFRSIRLIKKGNGKWVRRVHQYYKTTDNVGQLDNPILHFPHPSLHEFVESINRWSSWHAIANKEEGKRSTPAKILIYPPAHFVDNFILKLGFLDGMRGLVYSLVMTAHSFLSWSKLWMLQKGFTRI
jgi:glycosyltransferase involved in cell wall biosynthesis